MKARRSCWNSSSKLIKQLFEADETARRSWWNSSSKLMKQLVKADETARRSWWNSSSKLMKQLVEADDRDHQSCFILTFIYKLWRHDCVTLQFHPVMKSKPTAAAAVQTVSSASPVDACVCRSAPTAHPRMTASDWVTDRFWMVS